MDWNDVHEIAIQLSDTYPNDNPLTINFVELKNRIMALEDFSGDPQRCGEKILEAVQMAWIDELDDFRS